MIFHDPRFSCWFSLQFSTLISSSLSCRSLSHLIFLSLEWKIPFTFRNMSHRNWFCWYLNKRKSAGHRYPDDPPEETHDSLIGKSPKEWIPDIHLFPNCDVSTLGLINCESVYNNIGQTLRASHAFKAWEGHLNATIFKVFETHLHTWVVSVYLCLTYITFSYGKGK